MTKERDLLAEAIKLVNHHFLGLLTTVDEHGVPHSRWMGAAAQEGIKFIYTLSGRNSRKIQHLGANPHVCWVFQTPNLSDVVTLYGQAQVQTSPLVAQAAWDRLSECTRHYAMSALSDDGNLDFIAIETAVESVEFLSPRLKIFHPQIVFPATK